MKRVVPIHVAAHPDRPPSIQLAPSIHAQGTISFFFPTLVGAVALHHAGRLGALAPVACGIGRNNRFVVLEAWLSGGAARPAQGQEQSAQGGHAFGGRRWRPALHGMPNGSRAGTQPRHGMQLLLTHSAAACRAGGHVRRPGMRERSGSTGQLQSGRGASSSRLAGVHPSPRTPLTLLHAAGRVLGHARLSGVWRAQLHILAEQGG